MDAPAPPYLDLLLRQDFDRTCAKVRYCFSCEIAFCLDCCPLHPQSHHPGDQCRVAQLKVLRGVISICEEDVAGIGYDWRSIQKFKDSLSGRRYIPLRRNILPGVLAMYCVNCNDRMYVRSRHCCAACRLQNVGTGNARGRSKVIALVQAQLNQHAAMDRFCTVCGRLFASSCCSDHIGRHHPGAIGTVIRLVRHRGSILAPTADLEEFPPQTLADVETVFLNDMAMVPICRGEDHPDPEGEAGNLCARCFKVICNINSSYCCLHCMAADA